MPNRPEGRCKRCNFDSINTEAEDCMDIHWVSRYLGWILVRPEASVVVRLVFILQLKMLLGLSQYKSHVRYGPMTLFSIQE